MKFLLFPIVALLSSAVAHDNDTTWTQEAFDAIFGSVKDAAAPTPVMVANHNYSIETHHMVTADGYILEMHRIPGSPTCPLAKGKPVVLLMHGFLLSSADWVLMGPGKSFGYILADSGFDVWMGNARGNTYSRNHTSHLSPKDYWAFSWHEIGFYDLPAMIDYVLETTGQHKMIYAGHSQGTTSFFVMTSQKPEYNDKIDVMFALAPGPFMEHMFNPLLRILFLATSVITKLGDLFGIHEIPPSIPWEHEVVATFCGQNLISRFICSNVIFIVGGYNRAELNVTMLPAIFGHFPASASFHQLIHFGQISQSHKLRQYDYGSTKNVARYGSVTPPDYDLSLITTPVHLIYGANDWLASPKDIIQLYNNLGNAIEMRQVADENWTHFDQIWGIHAKELVYDPILATLRETYNYSVFQ